MKWVRVIVVSVFLTFLVVSFGAAKDQFEYDPHGKKDPMVPVVDKNGKVLFEAEDGGRKSLALRLQGIIFKSRGVSKAIIDKRLYKEGDKVSGFLLKEIYPDHVVLTDGKENYELWLKPKKKNGKEKKSGVKK